MQAPTHTREHQASLVRKAQAGSIEARNQLIEENLGLIYATINKVKPHGSASEEHVYAATEAFIRCVNSFDPDKGFTLSTYVCRSIPGELYRLHNSLKGAIRVPELCKSSTRARWDDAARARWAESIPKCEPHGNQKLKALFRQLVAKEPEPARTEKQGKLWAWVADLPDTQREIIRHRLNGLAQPQIALATGLSEMDVHVEMKKAIQMLRARAA